MEKVRFEAFNVEELRVLRRACYEAGAAFGDPGHTAAERATLDDLAVVKYDKKQSAFRAFPVDRPWCACQIAYPDEIVGNIYDNPDLLKQGEDTQK